MESTVSHGTVGVLATNVNVVGDVIVGNKTNKERYIEEFHLSPLITSFRGREDDTNQLTSLFFKNNHKNVVICGLPGFGKTECAKQFAKYTIESKKIEKIFWMNAENEEYLTKSFKDLAKTCGLKEVDDKTLIKDIYKHFNEYKCLFVFDNAISRRDVIEFQPSHGHLLLVTSQEKDWGEDYESIELSTLTSDSAIQVLKSILCEHYVEKNRDLYKQLAAIVDNVPLGLQIVGGYVRQHVKCLKQDFNLDEYIETVKQSQEKIINVQIPSSIPNTYQKSIYGAMRVSLNKIANEDDTELKENAFEVLCLCSYLNPENLSIRIMKRISCCTDIKLKLALTLLDNFSFVNFKTLRNNSDSIKIHRLTQDIVRLYFKKCYPEQQSKCYMYCLRYIIDDDYCDIRNKWAHFYFILRHADENAAVAYSFYKNNSPETTKNKIYNNVFKNILVRFVQYGCFECIRQIFEDIDNSKIKEYVCKYELLYKAAEFNHVDVLEVLLKYVDINTEDENLNTTLHTAVRTWNIEAVKFLLQPKYNANINLRNKYGDTPLFHFFYGACYKEDINCDVVRQILNLLQCEQNKKITNKNGDTLLHAASFSSCAKLITLLIKSYNLDVNQQNGYGNTPLHTLIYYLVLNHKLTNVIQSINALKMFGAQLDIQNKDNQTPLDMLLHRNVNYHFKYKDLVPHLTPNNSQFYCNNDIVTTLLH